MSFPLSAPYKLPEKENKMELDEYYPWLALGYLIRFRPYLSRRLIEKFLNPENIFSSSLKSLLTVEGMTADLAKSIVERRFDRDKILEGLKKLNKEEVKIIHMNDPAYPELLKQIEDPPLFFYMKGDIQPQDSLAISIVGTRRPTVYGKKVAELLSKELSHAGFTVISGVARGIDSIAHMSALTAGGRSIGVLGCGIDVVYPKENRSLILKIIKSGVIISEFPPEMGPEKQNFPRRNRIISGLSLGTVVVEAAEKSGSLITAGFALDQGREVFAIPGNINSRMSRGTNNLIKEGAKIVTNVDDILTEFELLLTHRGKRGIKNVSTCEVSLTGIKRKIYSILSLEPKHIDQIILESKVEPQKVIHILLDMELKGLIEQLPGHRYVKAHL